MKVLNALYINAFQGRCATDFLESDLTNEKCSKNLHFVINEQLRKHKQKPKGVNSIYQTF